MKYIRTKDGHFLGFLTELSISLGGKTKGKYYYDVIDRRFHRLGAGILQEKNILKQTDTIEELCECFVGIYKDEEEIEDKEISYFLSNFANMKCFKEIYGAIWTNKGLIFVARMNNEGVLELL